MRDCLLYDWRILVNNIRPAKLSFKLLNEKKGDSRDRDSIIVSYKIIMVMITNLMRLLT